MSYASAHIHYPLEEDPPMAAEVIEEIRGSSTGLVRAKASFWTARLFLPDPSVCVPPGTRVTVIGRIGNTLIILPYDILAILPYLNL